MKKLVAILLTCLILFSIFASASATDIRVPIDLEMMSDEELSALIAQAAIVLKSRGIVLSVDDASAQSVDVPASEVGETQTDNGENEVESLSEGATELSDESFIEDLSAGLCARWAINEDTSLMSDKQLVKYYTQLVNAELAYVSKYTEYKFIDGKLGEYATNYINALQSQFIAITEFFSIDENQYHEYWRFGYNTRARYIYLINKAYGLDIPSQYKSILKEMVDLGVAYNYIVPVENALKEELSKVELDLNAKDSKTFLYVMPMNILNSSPNTINSLTVKINFLNDKEVVVDEGTLVSYENVESGKHISTKKVSTDDHFSHVSYSYSFRVETGVYYETISGTVVPDIQYSWDGSVKKNGELASGQPAFAIENLKSGWEVNESWNKTLYVPVLKFNVKNIGTGEADRVTVRCVFTNSGTKEIWDEDTTYVVGSSDSPLKVGYSKTAFVYSSVGYKTALAITPELTVDIYINDKLMDTITIK